MSRSKEILENLDDFTDDELRKELMSSGLRITGEREVLRARLKEFYGRNNDTWRDSATATGGEQKSSNLTNDAKSHLEGNDPKLGVQLSEELNAKRKTSREDENDLKKPHYVSGAQVFCPSCLFLASSTATSGQQFSVPWMLPYGGSSSGPTVPTQSATSRERIPVTGHDSEANRERPEHQEPLASSCQYLNQEGPSPWWNLWVLTSLQLLANPEHHYQLHLMKTIDQTRHWNIQFSGKPDEDAEQFLSDFIIKCDNRNIKVKDRFKLLAEVLKNKALSWFHCEASEDISWEVFERKFQKIFVSERSEVKLLEKIWERQQKPEETAFEFIIDMRDMYRRLGTIFVPKTVQLDKIFHGLLGDYLVFIDRSDFEDYDDILHLTRKLEERWSNSSRNQSSHSWGPSGRTSPIKRITKNSE